MVGRDSERDDRVLGFTRGLSLFIVPFLLVALVILYLFPGETTRLWAWTIPSTMTSMTLASAYLGGAYFFLRVQREPRWTAMKLGFPAVALFSGLLGVATILHWDKFNHEHVSFWLWAGLYFTAPPLVVLAWVRNMRYAAPPAPDEPVLSPVVRVVVGLVGAGAVLQGAIMFLWPDAVIDAWPWPLTPLTCRVLGAVLCLAAAGLGAWFDPRWAAFRLMTEVAAVMVTLILLAAVRARDELDASAGLAWPLLIGMVALLVGAVAAVGPLRVAPASGAPRATRRPELTPGEEAPPRSRRPRAGAAPGRAPAGRRSAPR